MENEFKIWIVKDTDTEHKSQMNKTKKQKHTKTNKTQFLKHIYKQLMWSLMINIQFNSSAILNICYEKFLESGHF